MLMVGEIRAAGEAGHVLSTNGSVKALTDGKTRSLSRGDPIYLGDLIRTDRGRVQIRFKDGALVSLDPESELGIKRYNLSGKSEDVGSAVMQLVRGSLRTITGQIGGTDDEYRLETPVGTVKALDTLYALQLCDYGQCGGGINEGLFGHVIENEVIVTNESGQNILTAGTYFEVSSSESPPTPILKPPGRILLVAAASEEIDPVGDVPVDDKPVDDDPAVGGDPVGEAPEDEDPVVGDPAGEAPEDEDPVVGDPVGEAPEDEDPVVGDPVGEDPVDEDPVVEDPKGEQGPETDQKSEGRKKDGPKGEKGPGTDRKSESSKKDGPRGEAGPVDDPVDDGPKGEKGPGTDGKSDGEKKEGPKGETGPGSGESTGPESQPGVEGPVEPGNETERFAEPIEEVRGPLDGPHNNSDEIIGVFLQSDELGTQVTDNPSNLQLTTLVDDAVVVGVAGQDPSNMSFDAGEACISDAGCNARIDADGDLRLFDGEAFESADATSNVVLVESGSQSALGVSWGRWAGEIAVEKDGIEQTVTGGFAWAFSNNPTTTGELSSRFSGSGVLDFGGVNGFTGPSPIGTINDDAWNLSDLGATLSFAGGTATVDSFFLDLAGPKTIQLQNFGNTTTIDPGSGDRGFSLFLQSSPTNPEDLGEVSAQFVGASADGLLIEFEVEDFGSGETLEEVIRGVQVLRGP